MPLGYLHGEGIVFSTLIHGFAGLLGGAVLLFAIYKFRSVVASAVALAYLSITVLSVLLSQTFDNSAAAIIGATLTLPWRLILPCYNLDRSCPLSAGVAFICAVLNAAVLCFGIGLVSLVRHLWQRDHAR